MSKKFIFGVHPIEEALRKDQTLDKVWISTDTRNPKFRPIIDKLIELGIPFVKAPQEKLTTLVSNPNHQGIVAALSPVSFQSWEEIVTGCYERGEDPLLLVLDGITDVRNFGAIVRSAACAGVHAVVVPMRGAAAIGMDSVKTSAGAVFRVPICREAHLINAVQRMRDHGLRLAVATEKGESKMYDTALNGPLVLVMGSEETGPDPAMLRLADSRVSIPMAGDFDSLNVSVAAGVILFEILRQRTRAI